MGTKPLKRKLKVSVKGTKTGGGPSRYLTQSMALSPTSSPGLRSGALRSNQTSPESGRGPPLARSNCKRWKEPKYVDPFLHDIEALVAESADLDESLTDMPGYLSSLRKSAGVRSIQVAREQRIVSNGLKLSAGDQLRRSKLGELEVAIEELEIE